MMIKVMIFFRSDTITWRQLPQAKQGHTWFDFDWYWYNVYTTTNHSRDCQNSQNALLNLMLSYWANSRTLTIYKWCDVSFRQAGRPETYGLDMKKIQLLPKAEELQKSLQNDNLGIILVLSLNSMEKKYPNRKKRGSKSLQIYMKRRTFLALAFWSM